MVAALIVAVLVGCGSSSVSPRENSSRETTKDADLSLLETPLATSSLSKTQYIAKANAVCSNDLAELQARVKDYADEEGLSIKNQKFSADASEHFLLPGLQFLFDHLHYLGARAGEKHRVETILTPLQAGVFRGQKQRVSSPRRLEEIFIQFNQLADRYGFHRCPVTQGLFE